MRGIALIIMGRQFPGTLASAEVPGVGAFRTPATENPPKCSKISLREHFLTRKLLPQKMHFFPPATCQASTWPHAAAIVLAANQAAAVTGAAPSEQGPHLQAAPLSQVTPLTNYRQTQTLTLHRLCSRQAYPAQHTLALWLSG